MGMIIPQGGSSRMHAAVLLAFTGVLKDANAYTHWVQRQRGNIEFLEALMWR